jgi:hypothetical protein
MGGKKEEEKRCKKGQNQRSCCEVKKSGKIWRSWYGGIVPPNSWPNEDA